MPEFTPITVPIKEGIFPFQKGIILTKDHFVGGGNDSLCFHHGKYAIHVYRDLNLGQVERLKDFTNDVANWVGQSSVFLTLRDDSRVPIRVNTILRSVESISEINRPASISPWIDGMNFCWVRNLKRDFPIGIGLGDYFSDAGFRTYDRKYALEKGELVQGSESLFEKLIKDFTIKRIMDEIKTLLNGAAGVDNISVGPENIKITPTGLVVTDLFYSIERDLFNR